MVHWAWGGLSLGGLAWQAWRRRGDRVAEAGVSVLVLAVVPPLSFVLHSTPVFPHYFIVTYPAQYVAAGVALAVVTRRVRWLGWTVLCVSAAAQVWALASLGTYLSSHATPGGYGVPLSMQLQAADLAKAVLEEGPATELLIAGRGESPKLDEFSAVNSVLLRPVPHRFVDVDRSAVFPNHPAVVLLRQNLGEQAEHYLAAAASISRVPLRAGEGALQVLLLPAAAAPPPSRALDPPYLLANGVSLYGYDPPLQEGSASAAWQLHWDTGTPSDADYHIFNHLLDADGMRVAQADAAAFAARQWSAGDAVISRFVLSWPSDTERPFTVRTGMYTYPAIENVPVLDVAGNPSADAVEISLQ